MNMLYSFTIKRRLFLLSVLSLLLIFIVGIESYIIVRQLNDTTQKTNTALMIPSLKLGAIVQNYQSARIALRDSYVLKEVEKQEDMRGKLKGYMKKTMELLDSFAQEVDDNELKEKIRLVMASTKVYFDGVEDTLRMPPEQAQLYILGPLKKKAQEARNAQVSLEEIIASKVNGAHKEQVTSSQASLVRIALFTGVGVFFLLIAEFFISRSILTPLQKVVDSLRQIASGNADLTRQLEVKGADEVAELSQHYNHFVGRLREMIASVKKSSYELSISTSSLQQQSHLGAQTAEKISGQIEAIASTSEELSTASSSISQNCQNVAIESDGACQMAQDGSSRVEELIRSMEGVEKVVSGSADSIQKLGEQSSEIGTIISTIKEIADQTNLLALNAAIEAARAGESGRGFAVVADEVRKLAERTTKATSEIQAMIGAVQSETQNAVTCMQEGVQIVSNSSVLASASRASLAEIVNHIQKVNNQANEIFLTSQEQASAITEIAARIHLISESAGANATTANQGLELASSLETLAATLNSFTQKFVVA